MNNPKVLCFDAGGLRGMFSIQILKELERVMQRPAYDVFDMIVGVSAGAIIGFTSALLRKRAVEIEDIFIKTGSAIFDRDPFTGAWELLTKRAWAGTEALTKDLQSNFGSHKRLKAYAQNRPMAACIAADCSVSPGRACVFSSYPRAGTFFHGTNNITVWEALRASTAVPFFLQPCTIRNIILDAPKNSPHCTRVPERKKMRSRSFLDGGLVNANPSEFAYFEAQAVFGKNAQPTIVSIGTGQLVNVLPASLKDQWLPEIGIATLETAMSTYHAVPVMTQLLGDKYFRIDGPVAHSEHYDIKHIDSWQRDGRKAAAKYSAWESVIKMLKMQ